MLSEEFLKKEGRLTKSLSKFSPSFSFNKVEFDKMKVAGKPVYFLVSRDKFNNRNYFNIFTTGFEDEKVKEAIEFELYCQYDNIYFLQFSSLDEEEKQFIPQWKKKQGYRSLLEETSNLFESN